MNPTYHNLGNHTEAIEIDFCPQEISFEKVVDLFWDSHNPIGTARKAQYKTAFWYADEQQRETLLASWQRTANLCDQEPTTELLALETFFNAEDYHQKYILQRHDGIMKKFRSFYPRFDDFVNSTAAARLNGIAYGCKSAAEFEEEISRYGFSSDELTAVLR